MLQRFIAWADVNNWHIELSDAELPAEIMQRYDIPSEWLDFVRHFRSCANASGTKWFLMPEDYAPKECGFQWNEFELQSLEAAQSDPLCAEQWTEQIRTYWNKYLPIVMDVEGEYAYFAIDTDTGEVVHGSEPEFEECDAVSESFHTFLEQVINGGITL